MRDVQYQRHGGHLCKKLLIRNSNDPEDIIRSHYRYELPGQKKYDIISVSEKEGMRRERDE